MFQNVWKLQTVPLIRNTHSTLISLWTCKEYRVLQVAVLGKGGPHVGRAEPKLAPLYPLRGWGSSKGGCEDSVPPEHPAPHTVSSQQR